jgi:hypothetical protein
VSIINACAAMLQNATLVGALSRNADRSPDVLVVFGRQAVGWPLLATRISSS